MAGQQDQTSTHTREATRTVEKAWEALPAAHRDLLIEVGASQWTVVEEPLGLPTHKLLRSAGSAGLSAARIRDTDAAVAVWLPTLRIVVFNASHPALTSLNDQAFSHALARTAWHEWGHALSIARCTDDDVRAGDRLLQLAPTVVANAIRDAGYRHYEYTHELVANIYAALVERSQRKVSGRAPWLHQEIYDLVKRVTGWTD